MSETPGGYDLEVGLQGNLGARLLLAPEASRSGVAVVEHTLPAGKLAAPLHRHTKEDEISVILQGTMGIQEGEEVRTVEAGEIALKERGVWHTFWNPGPGELRFLEIIAPGEFARYFEESAEILSGDGEPDEESRAKLAALHEAYGFEMDPESVPALIERHDLDDSDL